LLDHKCLEGCCGDGVILGNEQCDDFSTIGLDGCDSKCQIEPGWICSPNNTSIKSLTFSYTASTCHTICGDGLRIGPDKGGAEECDDGNLVDGDGCSSQCFVEQGYVCSGGTN